MAFAVDGTQSMPLFKKRIIDFEERPRCQTCKNPMIICSHSTPSKVVGFEGTYYTAYIEYTCGEPDCSQYRRKKFRAPNPWRIDRHKYDCEVEAEVIHYRFKEKKTYREIEATLKMQHGIKISQKTIGNIITRYETISKLGTEKKFSTKFKENGGIFIGIDAMAPLKGEDKHIVAVDHFTHQTLLVERVRSETIEVHVVFQRKLKRLVRQHKIKVLGIMSDDHVAQRKAIQIVWGPKMKHCRCLFHFQKRIMLEPFNLNRRLKTKAKARIRKTFYVKQFREGKLDSIKNSVVWAYLLEIIKDLAALQNWKNKRNDTDLESIAFYKRLVDIYFLLKTLKNHLSPTFADSYKIEKQRLKVLMKEVKAILNDFKQDYEDLLRLQGYQKELKRIFEAHEEPSQEGLAKLVTFADMLEARLKAGLVTCDAEKFYIEQLCSFVHDRGESLFQYRDINHANNTNNAQEMTFKNVKHTIRRTQGTATGARYFQHHAKYMLYVDPHLSREEIRQMLLRADYKAVAKIMKEERALRKRPLSQIKNKKKWEARKKKLKEKLQEI